MKQELLERVKNRIRAKEGLKLKPYKCPTGHWTWGYGHNCEGNTGAYAWVWKFIESLGPNPTEADVNYHWVLEKKNLSIKDANFQLAEDVTEAISNLRRVLPKIETYSEQRQIALIDMMFNLGMGAFMEFVKMIYAIEIEDWQEAGWQVKDSLYYKQVGPRGDEIIKMLQEG